MVRSTANGQDRILSPAPWMAAAVMAWLALFPITSVDAYYHLAVGKWIVQHGEIPDRAIFSATFGERPWHDNEWGFQWIVAMLAPTVRAEGGVLEIAPSGRVALVLLRAAALFATLALLSAAMARAGVDRLSRAVGVVLAAFLTFNNLFWAIRPQILSYLGLAAMVFLLQRDRDGDRAAAAWCLPLLAVWANLHGAFIVGIVLLGVETTGAVLERDGRWKRLAVWTALAPLAACLNPLGWRQLLHPFLYVLRPEIHAGNAEWTRPDWLHLPLLVATVLVFAGASVLAGRPRWADLLRVVAFLALLASAIRHLPLAAIVLVPATLGALTRAARRDVRLRHVLPTAPGWGDGRWRLLAAATAVLAIVSLSGARFVGPIPSFSERPIRAMPEDAVRRIVSDGSGGTVLNSYRMGGFLMFRMYPDEAVFMDGRNDVYEEFRERVYNPIVDADPGWRDGLRDAVAAYDIRWVLLDADAGLAAALATEPGWRRVEVDDPGIALWRREPATPGAVAGPPRRILEGTQSDHADRESARTS